MGARTSESPLYQYYSREAIKMLDHHGMLKSTSTPTCQCRLATYTSWPLKLLCQIFHTTPKPQTLLSRWGSGSTTTTIQPVNVRPEPLISQLRYMRRIRSLFLLIQWSTPISIFLGLQCLPKLSLGKKMLLPVSFYLPRSIAKYLM